MIGSAYRTFCTSWLEVQYIFWNRPICWRSNVQHIFGCHVSPVPLAGSRISEWMGVHCWKLRWCSTEITLLTSACFHSACVLFWWRLTLYFWGRCFDLSHCPLCPRMTTLTWMGLTDACCVFPCPYTSLTQEDTIMGSVRVGQTTRLYTIHVRHKEDERL